ncbi:MAG: PAS domain-containing protein [Methanoregula sp.]|jgi:PAS domain S-box-containing protein
MTAKPDSAILIFDLLKMNPRGLNIREISELTGLNRMSVAKYLDIMTATETVVVRMIGSSKIYYIPQRIPASAFLEYTSKHYCITDSNLKIVQFHEWIPSNVGLTKRDMDGVSLTEMLRDRIVNFADCEEAFKKALAGEPSTVVVEDLYKGVHKFFEIHHMPIRFPDGTHGMMAISMEITDKKLVEIELRREAELFRDMVEHLPDIVFTTDLDCRITYISPRAKDYGIVPADIVGRHFWDLAVPEDLRKATAALLAVKNTGVSGVVRFRHVSPDGRTVIFEAACSSRIAPAGPCTGISGTLRDMTGRAAENRYP